MSGEKACFPAFNMQWPQTRSAPTTLSVDAAGIADDTAA